MNRLAMSSHRGLISKYHLIFMCYSSSILLTENSHFDSKLKPSPCLQLIITALVTISAWTPVYPAAAFHSSEYLWCFQSQRVRKTGSFHILRLSNKSTGKQGFTSSLSTPTWDIAFNISYPTSNYCPRCPFSLGLPKMIFSP